MLRVYCLLECPSNDLKEQHAVLDSPAARSSSSPMHLPPSRPAEITSYFDHQSVPSRFDPCTPLPHLRPWSSPDLLMLPKTLHQPIRDFCIRMLPLSVQASEGETDLLPHEMGGWMSGPEKVGDGGLEAVDGI